MRIDRVRATAFGPLAGDTLELAPGLTVVVGGNESAKSTWHAATYAALCGIRRGGGRPQPRDAEFRDRHQPWGGGSWRAGATITLDDGREIDLTQELDSRVDCHAVELPLGRDLSNEIMFDGAPDASRWLGLNRRAFEATACIRQNDLLAVRDSGDALSELLSRAAATGGVDESTARALGRLEGFRKDHIGVNRANSVKPWRQAIEAEAAAREAVERASEVRADFDRRAEEVEALEAEAARLRRAAKAARAARLRSEADALEARLAAASRLAEELGPRRPDAGGAAQESLATVTAAMTRWSGLPAVPAPGEDPADIERALAALPAAPEHDTSPAQDVASAHGRYTAAVEALAAHDRLPGADETAAPTGPSAAELRDLATRLEILGPAPEAARPTAPAVTARRARWPWALVGAGVLALAAGVAAQQWVLAGIGVVVAVAGVVLALRAPSAPVTPGVDQSAAWRERRAPLEERATAFGVAADAGACRAAATEAEAAERRHAEHQSWVARRDELESTVATTGAELRGTLASRVDAGLLDDLPRAYDTYLRTCAAAAETAALAARRPLLESRLEQARDAVQRRSGALQQREAARTTLHEAAVLLGDAVSPAETQDDAALVAALQRWLDASREEAGRYTELDAKWSELDRLLGSDDLETMAVRAQEARTAAESAAAGMDAGELDDLEPTDAERVAAMERDAAGAESEASRARGGLQEFAKALPDVSVLEEQLEAARDELRRVEDLRLILEKTERYMTDAQDRVHRDIAPRLQASLVRWLPVVTQGRYTEAAINPQSLTVQVRADGGSWRRAELLSYGTAEQIYLLLRLSLVEHLTAEHDTCPLLLDDVTVHADTQRTHAILELLLQVSQERQVVLFTQEDQVATWAEERLSDPSGRVVRLPEVPAR